MKRHIFLALVIVTVGAFLTISTYTYFTSGVKSEGNTFATGTLKLGGIFGDTSVEEKFAHLSLSNITPGQSSMLDPVKLKNMGSLPFKLYRITSSNIVDESGLAQKLSVKVKISEELVYEGKLGQLVESNGGYFDTIENVLPGTVEDLTIEVSMDEDAGNGYKDKSVTCDLNVYATQNEVPSNGENGVAHFGPAVDPSGNVTENTFSVDVKNTIENVEFTWNWQPSDDKDWGSFEYYILEIKHETGNPTTDLQAGKLKMKLDPIDETTQTIESTNGILASDLLVDWDNDKVCIRKDAFPADWKGFEVKISGVQKFGGQIISIPYRYWSLGR